jgi:hypothetical protein
VGGFEDWIDLPGKNARQIGHARRAGGERDGLVLATFEDFLGEFLKCFL